MHTTAKTFVSTLTGLAMLVLAPGIAPANAASAGWDFCGTTGADWSTSTQGRSGTVTVTGDCAIKANWRIDVYVNGEYWATSSGSVNVSEGHQLRTSVPTMPKPNDKRGNYTYAKITYSAGQTWKNVHEEDLGYLPCKGCTT
ncbi:hypothetical protein BWI15_02775 [Kribbella sp. ALI-6-A]|uniref:hypothetical protein n=1 Tax=Kribbella sp. ALI-6-A TaxID=1933817 RepID=UPI00097C0E78|nr:hypothetical protein [Kribbella sp. ALI-6-A]ONI77456.1 hypothetical protein BWI15_02775 [Kribbella sp. ALI-6-A]